MFRKTMTTAVITASIACLVPIAVYAQAPRESLTVSGHWVIEVRNPDGALVTRREFDNHLAPFGQAALINLFTRASGLGRYAVVLTSSGPSPFGGDDRRTIREANHDGPVPAGSLNHPAIAPGIAGFVLSGSTTTNTAGFITKVGTQIGICTGTRTPRECADTGGSELPLTETTIAPLGVAAGNVVNVTVTIAFGSNPDPPIQ